MFFFQHSNILLQSLLLCIVSEEKSNVILTLLSYRQGSFLSFSFFFFLQDFLFDFLQFEYDIHLRCWCFGICHSVFWAFWNFSLVSIINCRKIISHYYLKYFFFFSDITVMCVFHLLEFSCKYSCTFYYRFLKFFFPLGISVSTDITSSSLIVSSVVFSLMMTIQTILPVC